MEGKRGKIELGKKRGGVIERRGEKGPKTQRKKDRQSIKRREKERERKRREKEKKTEREREMKEITCRKLYQQKVENTRSRSRKK